MSRIKLVVLALVALGMLVLFPTSATPSPSTFTLKPYGSMSHRSNGYVWFLGSVAVFRTQEDGTKVQVLKPAKMVLTLPAGIKLFNRPGISSVPKSHVGQKYTWVIPTYADTSRNKLSIWFQLPASQKSRLCMYGLGTFNGASKAFKACESTS
jgi:hypothetical protein